jgi:uncharacterized protein YbbC (DUF1343 family)
VVFETAGRRALAQACVAPMRVVRRFLTSLVFLWFLLLVLLPNCGAKERATPQRPAEPLFKMPILTASVMLGIDVLESEGFAVVRGKRLGLLTHPAGVNRQGVSTVEVLRRAPGLKLICLFAPEHGIYGRAPASANVDDTVDPRTGLIVHSLYGRNRQPTRAQLKTIDALVIDLQDIGVRSYTYSVAMRYAMEACFQSGVEVIVLDRPNPLGGLKVDGPPLDRELKSGVGAFPVPYVHGLTIGELARLAASMPGVMDVPENIRARGRLTVVPMRGWRRDMRWPDTGLNFIPTSPAIGDFSSVVGYAMIGLGCEETGFNHSMGPPYSFQIVSTSGKSSAQLERDLSAFRLPGLRFQQITTTDGSGRPTSGVLVQVADWNAWNPTELSFHLMRLACRYRPPNPFLALNNSDASKFNKHVGSIAWWNALRRDGARVDVEGFLRDWRARARIYQDQTRKYWLYR